MTISTSHAALFLYIASLTGYVWFLYGNLRWIGRAASICLAGGLVLHYFALIERARAVDAVPYQDLYGSMSLFGWMVALTYVGLELFHRQRSVGAFVLPFVVVLVAMETMLGPERPEPPADPHGTVFALHVTLNILAYSAFAIAFVVSLIYLLQDRMLRDRRPGAAFWRFPPLELLERMSRSGVAVGVLALAVGIALGFSVSKQIHGEYWSGDPKEIVSLVILLAYGTYLWLGRTTAWRGARAAWLCVANFVIVLFTYTVVNVYLSGYHRYF